MTDTAVAARQILVPGRSCWVVSPQISGGLLVDGRDYFRALYEAALHAERFLLLAGWQFDADVPLLRGAERDAAPIDPRLLPFLRTLALRRPSLQIRLLCWDYSPAYFFQREWFQDYRFNWGTPPNLRFRFDDRHAVGASHHQKFAIVDGAIAFAGSMDLCNERWDERRHLASCRERCEPHGEDGYGPYHEVQTAVTGSVVSDLVELFRARWRSSGGGELTLPAPAGPWRHPVRVSLRIDAPAVGLSRTVAQTLTPEQPSVREIRQLYVDAIASAERSIYIENQYFGSSAVYEALLRRLIDRDRPRINVVMVYPGKLHSVTEELSMGTAQNRMFRHLTRAAERNGHALGVFQTRSLHADGREAARYIHSKLMIVDDRFMTVGSANTNNRSMGLDTELNLSWEAGPEDLRLRNSLRRARVSLLGEHGSLSRHSDLRALYEESTLVDTLRRFAARPHASLRLHPMTGTLDDHPVVAALESDGIELDPEGPTFEENFFESVTPTRRERWRHGLRRVRRRVLRGRWSHWRVAVDPPELLSKPPHPVWAGVAQWARRLAIPLIGAALLAVAAWALLTLFLQGLELFR